MTNVIKLNTPTIASPQVLLPARYEDKVEMMRLILTALWHDKRAYAAVAKTYDGDLHVADWMTQGLNDVYDAMLCDEDEEVERQTVEENLEELRRDRAYFNNGLL